MVFAILLRNFLSWLIILCRRSPISIAAAVIYIITQLSDDKKPLKGLIHFHFSCLMGNYPAIT